MDPLTALGVASNIIQLVQFATKLITESQEAYDSLDGASQRNSDVEGIASNLIALHQQLSRDLYRPPGVKSSVADEQLQRLTEESIGIADKLIGVIRGLKSNGKSKRWNSVKYALTTAWKQKDIVALQTKLTEIRQQLDTTLLVCLR